MKGREPERKGEMHRADTADSSIASYIYTETFFNNKATVKHIFEENRLRSIQIELDNGRWSIEQWETFNKTFRIYILPSLKRKQCCEGMFPPWDDGDTLHLSSWLAWRENCWHYD